MEEPAAGLDGLPTVGVEVKVTERVVEAIEATASVNAVDKLGVTGIQTGVRSYTVEVRKCGIQSWNNNVGQLIRCVTNLVVWSLFCIEFLNAKSIQ